MSIEDRFDDFAFGETVAGERIKWIRVSETGIINTLCCVIGAGLAYNISVIFRYWHVIVSLGEELRRCLPSP